MEHIFILKYEDIKKIVRGKKFKITKNMLSILSGTYQTYFELARYTVTNGINIHYANNDHRGNLITIIIYLRRRLEFSLVGFRNEIMFNNVLQYRKFIMINFKLINHKGRGFFLVFPYYST